MLLARRAARLGLRVWGRVGGGTAARATAVRRGAPTRTLLVGLRRVLSMVLALPARESRRDERVVGLLLRRGGGDGGRRKLLLRKATSAGNSGRVGALLQLLVRRGRVVGKLRLRRRGGATLALALGGEEAVGRVALELLLSDDLLLDGALQTGELCKVGGLGVLELGGGLDLGSVGRGRVLLLLLLVLVLALVVVVLVGERS